MARKRGLTDKAFLATAYDPQGKLRSIREIAKRLGITSGTVSIYKARLHLNKPPHPRIVRGPRWTAETLRPVAYPDGEYRTLEEVGKAIGGVTRERARQLLVGLQIQMRRPVPCHACTHCGKEYRQDRPYCSVECYSESRFAWFPCAYCQKPVRFSAARHKTLTTGARYKARGYTGKHFCDQKCQGKWLAYNHGFAVHPGRIKRGYGYIPQRRHVIVALINQGITATRIAEILGCALSGVCRFLKKEGYTAYATERGHQRWRLAEPSSTVPGTKPGEGGTTLSGLVGGERQEDEAP
jgi:hypothetical protein